MTLIAINAVTLGLETSPEVMAAFGEVLRTIDHFVLTIFVAEIGAKLFAKGLRFFRDPWNVFDFTVVTIALIPASGPLAVLRTLRVLRVLRLVSVMPRLRFVVEALLRAVPGISAIGGLMLLLFYVAAVMATGLFGADYPEWFGSVGASMYSLFQIMTLESWSMGIVRPVMEQYPYAWLFFVPFILIATFTMLNLFIAIIVDTMQTMHEQEMKEEHEVIGEVVHTESESIEGELRAMRQELRALRREISMENRS
ncbi:ion transporter [Thiohalomonas denitrificans]|nr:ion transporter [Thiohalomonas denitrificans]